MRLVVVHYHLNRGGVTSVVRSHLQSLAKIDALSKINASKGDEPGSRKLSNRSLAVDEVVLAYGGRASDWHRSFEEDLPFPVKHAVLPSLEYDQLQNSLNAETAGAGVVSDVEERSKQLLRELKQTLCESERNSTVIHVHNHALGKNAALSSTLSQLANEGWRVLLHIHDFAEDLRPQNYAHLLAEHGGANSLWPRLYPQAPQIHYATLNRADHLSLNDAGIPRGRLHLLPNPVSSSDHAPIGDQTRRKARTKLHEAYGVAETTPYVLYPVRGIRRKNLGEVLLWATLFGNVTFSITLEPKNEIERASYEAWRLFSEELSIPVIFGSGEKLSLDENYAAADAIISTSVAEGFGLVFLEAAIRDRPLFGRNLPGVTSDFVDSGMQFPGLANALLVPNGAFNTQELRHVYERQSRKLRADYGLPMVSETELQRQLNELFQRDAFDFGCLDTSQQRAVICKLATDEQLKNAVIALNPCIEVANSCLNGEAQELLVAARENKTVIEQHYSFSSLGHKLASIYQSLLSSEAQSVEFDPSIAKSLLEQFARTERLRPLRVEN